MLVWWRGGGEIVYTSFASGSLLAHVLNSILFLKLMLMGEEVCTPRYLKLSRSSVASSSETLLSSPVSFFKLCRGKAAVPRPETSCWDRGMQYSMGKLPLTDAASRQPLTPFSNQCSRVLTLLKHKVSL